MTSFTPGWAPNAETLRCRIDIISDVEQLLRHAGAKPEAGAAGSDDGSDVHVS